MTWDIDAGSIITIVVLIIGFVKQHTATLSVVKQHGEQLKDHEGRIRNVEVSTVETAAILESTRTGK